MSQAGRGRRFLVVAGSIALTLVGALGPASVHAEVLLVSDDRTVGHDFGFGPVVDTPSAPFADFDFTAPGALASQDSQVSPAVMTAVGTGSRSEGDPTETGDSTFQIVFDVTSPTWLTLSGSLDDDAGQGSADATLFSFVAATTIYSVGGSGPFSHEALLQPGQYRLRVQASGGFFSPQADTAYSVQALFAPPVPALSLAGPLWASGLLGWTGWRRLRT